MKNALESLLQPLTRLVNRQIAMKTPARELCTALDGRVVAVRVRHTALAMYFLVDSDGIRLTGEFNGEPDVAIAGSLAALASLAGRAGEDAVRAGSLDLVGDAEVAEQFRRLLQLGRPDPEEELAGLVGDAAAHSIGQFARSLGDWGRRARATFTQNLGEYLQEESRAVPSRHETDSFREAVENLRDDVERLEARLKRIEPTAAGRPDDARE